MFRRNESRLASKISLTLVFALLFSGTILTSHTTSANDTHVDDVSIIVPISCNLVGTNTTHSATINPGTATEDIGKTTLKVFCNDNNGFAIYAIGYTGDVDGTTTLVGNNTSQTINTGTTTSGTSSWSMKLTKETNASQAYQPNNLTIVSPYTAYSSVPTEWAKVATFSSKTDQTLGAVLYTTYKVYISSAQAADAYTGQVKYTLVHPQNETIPHLVACASGKICYNANTGTAEGTMGQQTASANASVTLIASNFSRSGYGFVGWSPDYNITSSSTIYGPNETITTPSDMSAGLPLYAVWVQSQGNLQGWTGCSNLTKADQATNILAQSITALTDQRDNQTYAVAKLADNKCWMIENLRLESTNSDNSTGSLAQGYGTSTIYGSFSGLANAEFTNFTNTNPPVANSLYSTDGNTTNTIQGGSDSYFYARMPRYNNINTSTRASSPTSGANSIYSYGNYYTWAAAMASIIEYTSPTTQTEGKTSETANTSLCPSGWRLPYGRDSGNGVTASGFSYLDIQLGGTGATSSSTDISKAWRAFPNNFIYSGSFNTSSANNRGAEGYYWSSTVVGSNGSYALLLRSGGVYPGTNNNFGKHLGSPVRCVVSL